MDAFCVVFFCALRNITIPPAVATINTKSAASATKKETVIFISDRPCNILCATEPKMKTRNENPATIKSAFILFKCNLVTSCSIWSLKTLFFCFRTIPAKYIQTPTANIPLINGFKTVIAIPRTTKIPISNFLFNVHSLDYYKFLIHRLYFFTFPFHSLMIGSAWANCSAVRALPNSSSSDSMAFFC